MRMPVLCQSMDQLNSHLTTMRYIDKYIKPGDRVLEIGAETGRYSHALARQGYAVDAVELVEHNIEIFRTISSPMRRSRLLRNALIYPVFRTANMTSRCC